MISLLLRIHDSKSSGDVNNKDIIRIYTMASTDSVTYQSFLCTVAYIG